MQEPLWSLLLLAVLFAVSGETCAQAIYRCGSTYQDRPCAGATVVDATPNTGVEVRGPTGNVVHSPSADKARAQRTSEQQRENFQNAVTCGLAQEPVTVNGNRIDCATAKRAAEKSRLTPDYIKR